MFEFWRSEEQKTHPRPQDSSSQSWYPSSVVTSPSSSRPATEGDTSRVSPAEAAGVIAVLRDKSSDELQKLLSDKEAYGQFLLSHDQVKIQNNLKNELCKDNSQLAEENLRKEPCIMELRNQCKIIRTTELAIAQEQLNDLEKQKEESLKSNSPASLLQSIQEALNKTEDESENVHQQLLDRDIDLGAFVQKYKKLRTIYHRRALMHLAAISSTRHVPA